MRFTIGSAVLLMAITAHAQETGTPFYQAIHGNDLGAVRALVQKSGVDAKDSRGTTPLMYAAAVGSLDAMKLLIEAGADVNAKNAFDATALMWAAGDIDKVRLLLSKGADVKAKSKIGRTPLLLAAFHDGASEIVRLMIDHGADVMARDKDGTSGLEAAASVNDSESVRLLLSKGADANAKDAANLTPLLQAAWNGDRNAEVVKLLLEHGADVNAVSAEVLDTAKNGPLALGFLTPLLAAVPQGSYETVELLVNAGANVNARDARGMTPLALAITSDRPEPRIVRLLLAKGADPDIKCKTGETALDWANKYHNPEVLSALDTPRAKPVAAMRPFQSAHYSPADLKGAVEKSVALLQRTSANFLNAGGCPACHAQNLTGVAVQTAHAHGVKVDLALESEQARMVASLRGGLEQTLYQLVDPPPGVEGMEYSLLQMSASGVPSGPAVDAIVFHVAALQRKEGDWPNYSTVRPPIEDGGFAHTAMGIRSLQLYFMPGRKAEFDDRIARAAQWLERANPRTTDDRVMQVLGIHWAHRQLPDPRMKELVALQRSDGSWGQTADLTGDAYATGEVLYTLHELGMPATAAAWRHGEEYLLRTQAGDGSWHVKTRAAGFQPYFQSGFPYEHDQWISSAGTAWAVMGLACALPAEARTISMR
jgi:ankyrin repeat protein